MRKLLSTGDVIIKFCKEYVIMNENIKWIKKPAIPLSTMEMSHVTSATHYSRRRGATAGAAPTQPAYMTYLAIFVNSTQIQLRAILIRLSLKTLPDS